MACSFGFVFTICNAWMNNVSFFIKIQTQQNLQTTAILVSTLFQKLYHPECAEAVKMEKRKLEQAPIADRLAHKLEEKYGRQKMRVMAEGFFGFNDEEYEELPRELIEDQELIN